MNLIILLSSILALFGVVRCSPCTCTVLPRFVHQDDPVSGSNFVGVGWGDPFRVVPVGVRVPHWFRD